MVKKRDRDKAMRIICDHYESDIQGARISSKYLTYNGLSKKLDPDHVVAVLGSMGYVTFGRGYDKASDKTICMDIVLTDSGRCYFEKSTDDRAEKRKMFFHDWKIAIFSAIAGALLSKPIWDFINYVVTLIRPA